MLTEKSDNSEGCISEQGSHRCAAFKLLSDIIKIMFRNMLLNYRVRKLTHLELESSANSFDKPTVKVDKVRAAI